MARTMTADFESRLETLRDNIKHILETGSDRASDIKDSAISNANKLGKIVRQHPLAAVAIAFAVGYLAMRIIRR